MRTEQPLFCHLIIAIRCKTSKNCSQLEKSFEPVCAIILLVQYLQWMGQGRWTAARDVQFMVLSAAAIHSLWICPSQYTQLFRQPPSFLSKGKGFCTTVLAIESVLFQLLSHKNFGWKTKKHGSVFQRFPRKLSGRLLQVLAYFSCVVFRIQAQLPEWPKQIDHLDYIYCLTLTKVFFFFFSKRMGK